MFVPPINLGQFQPSPATLADWIYQIWNYLQNNPIATQEQLQEYIATFITTSPETQELIGEGVEQYLTDNPPEAPVQSVQGKTGAVTLAFNDILKNNNTAPVYRAASMPSQSTLQAQYNLGYRLFVNTSTQEIYSITNTGGTTLVGKGKFDGTDIDLDTEQGDTTIAEAISDLSTAFTSLTSSGTWTPTVSRANVTSSSGNWYKVGKIRYLYGSITFGAATDTTFGVFIDESSLPSGVLGGTIIGCGRLNPSDTVVTLNSTTSNANVWLNNPEKVTAQQLSNTTIVFALIGLDA